MAALVYRPSPDRRFAALALTALAHVLLLLGWQATRLPPPETRQDVVRIQWIDLRPRAPAAPRVAPPPQVHAPERARERSPVPARVTAVAPAAAPAAPARAPTAPAHPAAPDPFSQTATPTPMPGGASLVERARHAVGAVDRALRKENNPYIVAPPDSPQLRMQKEMQAAHDMVPPKLWEAPKIAELVNNTGDGTRRTRVITGNGTYCINERPPTASIDTIETLGKVTPYLSCPKHETPANPQEWKTARDP